MCLRGNAGDFSVVNPKTHILVKRNFLSSENRFLFRAKYDWRAETLRDELSFIKTKGGFVKTNFAPFAF